MVVGVIKDNGGGGGKEAVTLEFCFHICSGKIVEKEAERL